MERERNEQGQPRTDRESGWARSQRKADAIALVIALSPIPISVVISWAMGSPPWRDRPQEEPAKASTAPENPGQAGGHGHR